MSVFDGNVFDLGVFDVTAGAGDATANGATLTANASIISGAAIGGAVTTGATVTATVTLIAGAAGVSVAASGATLTASALLVAGVAVGSAVTTGATVTAVASLIAGVATSSDGYATGATLTATASIIAGVATGDLVVVPEPIPVFFGVGARMRPPPLERLDAQAPGALLVVTVSVIPGAVFATQQAKVARRVLTRRAYLLPGIAAGEGLAPATVFLGRATLASGAASGFDAIKHDNEFLLLAA